MRPCSECLQFRFRDNEAVGGPPEIRAGKRVRRLKGEKPPCGRCPKIPEFDSEGLRVPQFPQYAIELSEKNRRAISFHHRCKLTGVWPDDRIVLRNAELIEETERAIRDEEQREQNGRLSRLIELVTIKLRL
jgi:hypothetical protein